MVSSIMETLQDIIPRDLLAIIETGEFEDIESMLIVGLEYDEENLKARFMIDPGDGDKGKELWELRIIRTRKEKIDTGWTSKLQLYSDHFLLYDYTKEW